MKKTGWAVKIERKDGSWFFAHGSQGNVTPIFSKRKLARPFANDLTVNGGFTCSIVKVEYWGPIEI